MMTDRKMLEKELREIKKSYNDVVNSNIKLMNEKNWAVDDKERALRRIKLALELIQSKSFKTVEDKEFKYDLIKILEDDYV